MGLESSLVLAVCILIPPACLAIFALIRRTAPLILAFSYSISTACISLAETLYEIFVARSFDAKFQRAPTVALELSLLGDLVLSFLALVVFGCTLALAAKKNLRPGPFGYSLAALLGGLYMFLPWLVWSRQAEAPQPLAWVWTLSAPVASALLTLRLVRARSGDAFVGPE